MFQALKQYFEGHKLKDVRELGTGRPRWLTDQDTDIYQQERETSSHHMINTSIMQCPK
jgi:hypothetical protein